MKVVVAGDVMTISIAQLQMRAEVLLSSEQASPCPDNSLIAFICEAVRLSREFTALSSKGLLPEVDDRFEKHTTAVAKWMAQLAPYLGLDGDGPYKPEDLIEAARRIRQWCSDKGDECAHLTASNSKLVAALDWCATLAYGFGAAYEDLEQVRIALKHASAKSKPSPLPAPTATLWPDKGRRYDERTDCPDCYQGMQLIDIVSGKQAEADKRTYGANWLRCETCKGTGKKPKSPPAEGRDDDVRGVDIP